jgi:hypothetical protein
MVRLRPVLHVIGPQKEESAMQRLLILGATVLACASFSASISHAETIACASEVPAARSGHWYYRIIDGRKCWYQGKAMIPKSSLYWPNSSVAEAEASNSEERPAQPTTDGRNSAASPPPAEPVAWPTPAVNEISFESRWLGLRSRN